MIFAEKSDLSSAALNILRRRYFQDGETTWEDVSRRVAEYVMTDEESCYLDYVYNMISNRYFIPNSPCLVNAGKPGTGLLACYVVDFPDSIEGIYKTKLDFALIAKKGGGCGTTLSKLRPEGSLVSGSVHGYAGGPVKFANTISHDMDALTQAGFRQMAIMFVMDVTHPDILKFITAKSEEGSIANANISVMVTDEFMKKVENDDSFTTFFDFESGRKYYDTYKARDVFNKIVDGAWKNGEPGLLFFDRINDSPYRYCNEVIMSTNPCAEQPLPFNGSCNLGSLNVPKFYNKDVNMLDLCTFEVAIRLAVRFLDKVIDKTTFPTKEIEDWALAHRPIGLGIMGFADYLLLKKIAYGSEESLAELEFILKFMKEVAEDESISLGEEKGVPSACLHLPVPRRNITLLTIAPTGTISLLGDVSSGIEPIFSEITLRNDKTGSYTLNSISASSPYFRCAVAANGAKEVTWKEHIDVLSTAQKWVDSGVSKTVNLPNNAHKEAVYNAFMTAWKYGCKGITVYRNGSRRVEVLSPKKVKIG